MQRIATVSSFTPVDLPLCDALRTGGTQEDAFEGPRNAQVMGSNPISGSRRFHVRGLFRSRLHTACPARGWTPPTLVPYRSPTALREVPCRGRCRPWCDPLGRSGEQPPTSTSRGRTDRSRKSGRAGHPRLGFGGQSTERSRRLLPWNRRASPLTGVLRTVMAIVAKHAAKCRALTRAEMSPPSAGRLSRWAYRTPGLTG